MNLDHSFQEAIDLLDEGDFFEALDKLDEVLMENPDHNGALMTRGTLRLEMGDYVSAEGDFLQLVRLRPDDPEAHFFRANARFYRGAYRDALQDLEFCVTKDPENAEAQLLRLQVLLKEGRTEEAINTLKKNEEQLQGHPFALLELKAAAYLQMGDLSAAKNAVVAFVDNEGIKQLEAEESDVLAFCTLAARVQAHQALEAGINALEKATADAGKEEFMQYKAVLLQESQQYEASRAVILQALATHPATEEFWLQLGNLHVLLEQPHLLQQDLQQARKLNARPPVLHFLEGVLLILTEEPRAAAETFAKALNEEPDHAEFRFFRAYALALAENYTEAHAELDQLVQSHPENPDFRLERSRLLFLQGKEEAARKDLEIVAKLQHCTLEEAAQMLEQR